MAKQKTDETVEKAETGNDIPKSSLTSAVTSDLPQQAPDDSAAQDEHKETNPLIAAGLGLVTVDGNGFQYVGIAPAREKDPVTVSGYPITPMNSTFKSLDTVPFSNSIRVKDPKSGEFYFPADDVTSWEGCELNGSCLVPKKKK